MSRHRANTAGALRYSHAAQHQPADPPLYVLHRRREKGKRESYTPVGAFVNKPPSVEATTQLIPRGDINQRLT